MGCHREGIIPRKDEIRQHVIGPYTNFSENIREFVSLSFRDASALISQDQKQYQNALTQTDGKPKEIEPVYAMVRDFEEPIAIDRAAAEIGVSTDFFVAFLKRHPEIEKKLSLTRNSAFVERDVFAENFIHIASALGLTESNTSIQSTAVQKTKTIPKTVKSSTQDVAKQRKINEAKAKIHRLQQKVRQATSAKVKTEKDHRIIASRYTSDYTKIRKDYILGRINSSNTQQLFTELSDKKQNAYERALRALYAEHLAKTELLYAESELNLIK